MNPRIIAQTVKETVDNAKKIADAPSTPMAQRDVSVYLFMFLVMSNAQPKLNYKQAIIAKAKETVNSLAPFIQSVRNLNSAIEGTSSFVTLARAIKKSQSPT